MVRVKNERKQQVSDTDGTITHERRWSFLADGGKLGVQQKPTGAAPTQLRYYGLFLRALQQYSGRRSVIGVAAVEEDRRTRLMDGRADNDVTWRPARWFCDYHSSNDKYIKTV